MRANRIALAKVMISQGYPLKYGSFDMRRMAIPPALKSDPVNDLALRHGSETKQRLSELMASPVYVPVSTFAPHCKT